ncbi:hypothetical protein OJ996_25245 [Luteolibacter sp. GHJ8]|uniref:Tfp pilus assembly protein PilX n=1 Tax=Luteolibacter rhizosphaerae TaxID=2989719 RepID=A0ABT3GBR6_9BACT|nr:hypothetical protein [Luteolibacter rhizosphaerae]MCW1916919.1 hypothetical protein [Luteolibacter rhizosphaerae]
MRYRRDSAPGFALVACIIMLVLILTLTLGLMGLTSIELKKSVSQDYSAVARANARMALVEAIGQLQKAAGPDQRVTATAELLGEEIANPHWTGVWRSTRPDGTPFTTRDDLGGGLKDSRFLDPATPRPSAFEWLVSGRDLDPAKDYLKDSVILMRSLDPDASKDPELVVPRVEVADASGNTSGHLAWWTGDLGVRANVGTRDPRSQVQASRTNPTDGGIFRVMSSQSADLAMMSGMADLEEESEARLATAGTAQLAAGTEWAREHAFDFTVDSMGVLADAAGGGLKRDLTAYFASTGSIPGKSGLGGLSDDDSLVGVEADQMKSSTSARHQRSGPRFGLLRDWARATVAFGGGSVASAVPELDSSLASESRSRALCNESAVKLTGNRRSVLQPVLVEASNYTQMSTYIVSASSTGNRYQLRQLMYPRVVLWNPYNVTLSSRSMLVMIQGNGRQEMWTENDIGGPTQWLNFEGGRSTSFNTGNIMNSVGYNDPYMGSYYFSVPATQFGPGECLVFSPARSAEYDGLSPYRPGPYDLSRNELSCEVAPDPGRAYYVSGSDISGSMGFRPLKFWYAPTPAWGGGVLNQSDDTRIVVKDLGGSSGISFEAFDALPQVSVLSASLQFGDGKEPRIAWSNYERMPMQLLARNDPRPSTIPNVRTREGIRLRWFREHPSNLANSGPLRGTPHFEDAVLANWNPRASYIMRSPWDNIAGTLAVQGVGGGPYFFGAYTRDLYDQAVSWQQQAPVPRNGKYHGNPFGPPQEGADRYVLFDVPRNETGIVSLAQLQHAKISDLIWHPSSAIGNSLADPRLGKGGYSGLAHTAALGTSSQSAGVGGFHENEIGWSLDSQRAKGKGEWAANARAMLGGTPASDNLVYDLSFEANRTLWDRYFLSTGTDTEKRSFVADPEENPLPNGRMRLASADPDASDALVDFHKAASQLMVDGSFNVNSTRVEAWKALLGSTRKVGYDDSGGAPFPRVLNPPGSAWKTGDRPDGDAAWAGYRVLTEGEIDSLAHAIVEEVKIRGPFLSLSDFVNRRLAESAAGRMGPLQAAIDRAEINKGFVSAYPLNNNTSLPNYSHPDNIGDPTGLEQTLKPNSMAWGATSFLTQADLLQVLGPVISARSDTFVIRTYGDAVDGDGNVQARAWCEAIVQRTPEPIRVDDSGLNPLDPGQPGDFGRRFIVTRFRWLSPAEI